MNSNILGSTVKDRITGFSGVVTGRVEYLTGCTQCLVAPVVSKDGAHRDSQWFDEQRLAVVKRPKIQFDNRTTPGADRSAPKHQ